MFGAFAFAALAFAVVPMVPSAEGSSAVISAIYLPLLGLSGAFFPLHRLPAGLHQLADVLPLSHLLSALRAAYGGGGLSAADYTGLLVTLAWALAGRARRRPPLRLGAARWQLGPSPCPQTVP